MAKIVLIGAGSHVFSKATITDILWYPELRDSTITLMDIAQEPLDLITQFAKTIIRQNGFNTKIESTTDRRKALEGADYVFITISVGDREKGRFGRAIPLKYGVEGSPDTIGAGGVFGANRCVPVILDICHDMEELCPNAWLLNYVNPMAINTWAMNDYTKIKNVGLCHSVQHTAADLLDYGIGPLKPVDVPKEAGPYYRLFHNQIHEELIEASYWVAGINHMAWFLELKWRGQDIYPLLRERFKDPAIYSGEDAHGPGPDIVRVEVFKAFGYFVTESSGHMASYLPYFKKTRALIDKYKLDEQKFANMWKVRLGWDDELREQIRADHKFPILHGAEYSAQIIHSIETGTPSRINANVKNRGYITNLPDGCCVEVPCLVDKTGIHPCYVGDLPPQLAGLNRTSINVQELAVRGIVEKDKTKIFQAILLDPLTSAILTIDEIRNMVDEMFNAEQKQYLKGYK